MGRKSKRRQGRRRQEDNSYLMPLDLDAVDLNEDKPRNAKQTSKLKKKLKKRLQREKKEKNRREKDSDKINKKQPRWHLITVSGGVPVEKNFLFTSIGNFVEVEFQPLGYHKVDKTSRFYLEGNGEAADAIGGLTKRIQGPDGSLLKIAVTSNSPPDFLLNADQVQVLKEVMARRYDSKSCMLDLTNLHHDNQLMERDMLVTLSSPAIMKQVLRLIGENIPHLKALNLCKNGLRVSSLKMFQSLHTNSSQLAALNLGHNYIGDMQVLKLIKMFPITELSLEGNPIVNQYKSNPVKYINIVKKELRNLKLLDNVDVDAYLLQNMKEKVSGQATQPPNSQHVNTASSSSSSSAISEPMVKAYLQQYYNLFDSPERSNLMAAYTPDAVMEIKSTVGAVGSCVLMGQSKISEAFTLIPATRHDQSTFSLDVKLANPSSAIAVVQGQCQLAGVEPVVTFSRTMNIIPYNAGLCCSQELLELR